MCRAAFCEGWSFLALIKCNTGRKAKSPVSESSPSTEGATAAPPFSAAGCTACPGCPAWAPRAPSRAAASCCGDCSSLGPAPPACCGCMGARCRRSTVMLTIPSMSCLDACVNSTAQDTHTHLASARYTLFIHTCSRHWWRNARPGCTSQQQGAQQASLKQLLSS